MEGRMPEASMPQYGPTDQSLRDKATGMVKDVANFGSEVGQIGIGWGMGLNPMVGNALSPYMPPRIQQGIYHGTQSALNAPTPFVRIGSGLGAGANELLSTGSLGDAREMYHLISPMAVENYQEAVGVNPETAGAQIGDFAGQAALWELGARGLRVRGIASPTLRTTAEGALGAGVFESQNENPLFGAAMGAGGHLLLNPGTARAVGEELYNTGKVLTEWDWSLKNSLDRVLSAPLNLSPQTRASMEAIRDSVPNMASESGAIRIRKGKNGIPTETMDVEGRQFLNETGAINILGIKNILKSESKLGPGYDEWANGLWNKIMKWGSVPSDRKFIMKLDGIVKRQFPGLERGPDELTQRGHRIMNEAKQIFSTNYGKTDPYLIERGLIQEGDKGWITLKDERNAAIAKAKWDAYDASVEIRNKIPDAHEREVFTDGMEQLPHTFANPEDEKIMQKYNGLRNEILDKLAEVNIGRSEIGENIGKDWYLTRHGRYSFNTTVKDLHNYATDRLALAERKVFQDVIQKKLAKHVESFGVYYRTNRFTAINDFARANKLKPKDVRTLFDLYEQGLEDVTIAYSDMVGDMLQSKIRTPRGANIESPTKYLKSRGMKLHKNVDLATAQELENDPMHRFQIRGENPDGTVNVMEDWPLEVRKQAFGEIRDAATAVPGSLWRFEKIYQDRVWINAVADGFGVRAPEKLEEFIEQANNSVALKSAKKNIEFVYGKPYAEIKKTGVPFYNENAQKSMDYIEATNKTVNDYSDEAIKNKGIIDRYKDTNGMEGERYKRMPESPGVWGRLSGQYLPEQFYDELVQIQKNGGMAEEAKALIGWASTLWKKGKTSWVAAGHTRNIVTNVWLFDWNDGKARHLWTMVKEAGKVYKAKSITGSKLFRKIDETGLGLMESSFANADMGYIEKALLESGIPDEKVPLTAMQIGKFALSIPGKIDKKVSGAYHWEDVLAKVAMTVTNLEKQGVTFETATGDQMYIAVKKALHAGMNYNEASPYVNWLSKTPVIGAPFAKWSSKMIPLLGETTIKKPFKILKQILGPLILAEIIAKMYGDSEEERKALNEQYPPELRNPVIEVSGKRIEIPTKHFQIGDDAIDLRWFLPMWSPQQLLAGVFPGNTPTAQIVSNILQNQQSIDQPIYSGTIGTFAKYISDRIGGHPTPKRGTTDMFPPLEYGPTMDEVIWGVDGMNAGVMGAISKSYLPTVAGYTLPKLWNAMRPDDKDRTGRMAKLLMIDKKQEADWIGRMETPWEVIQSDVFGIKRIHGEQIRQSMAPKLYRIGNTMDDNIADKGKAYSKYSDKRMNEETVTANVSIYNQYLENNVTYAEDYIVDAKSLLSLKEYNELVNGVTDDMKLSASKGMSATTRKFKNHEITYDMYLADVKYYQQLELRILAMRTRALTGVGTPMLPTGAEKIIMQKTNVIKIDPANIRILTPEEAKEYNATTE
jgi:hypothetical protein